jgi:hypothetical protein
VRPPTRSKATRAYTCTPELAVPEWLTSVSARHECGKERIRTRERTSGGGRRRAVRKPCAAPPPLLITGRRGGRLSASSFRPPGSRLGCPNTPFRDRCVLWQCEIQVIKKFTCCRNFTLSPSSLDEKCARTRSLKKFRS